jgi:hypothetical protein
MGVAEAAAELERVDDPGYPNTSAPDPDDPCRTLEPIVAPLDGIATPAMWSRLEAPLGRALDRLWKTIGLSRRARPQCWASIHFGRIALNAHGWERLRARVMSEEPDPALVPLPETLLQRIPEAVERLRALLSRGKLESRIEAAEALGERALQRARGDDPRELDAATLARGPIDETGWAEILQPWLLSRIEGESRSGASERVEIAILLEQRFGTELGRRLVARGALRTPVEVAYLTLEERLRAVHEDSVSLSDIASERGARIRTFVELEVPTRFWGRPRVESAKRR